MPPRPARYQEGLDRPLAVALRVLRLRWPTSEEELLGAWRRAALETHPDRGGDPEEFKGVQAAREYVEKALGGLVPVEAPLSSFEQYLRRERERKERHRREAEERRKATPKDRYTLVGNAAFWSTSKKGNRTLAFLGLRLTVFPRGGAYFWCMAEESEDWRRTRGEEGGGVPTFSPRDFDSEQEAMWDLEDLLRGIEWCG